MLLSCMPLQEDRLERDMETFSSMLLIPGINTWLQRGVHPAQSLHCNVPLIGILPGPGI